MKSLGVNLRTQQSCRPEGPNTLSSQDDHIMKKLRTIHANLGHPSNQVLHRTLKEAGASPEVLQKALTFECIHCARRGHAAPHRTSQIPQAQAKWEVVSVDTFWWHSPHKDPTGNPREHVVGISFMDEASDYHLAAIVRSGTKKQGSIRSEEFRNTFSRDWLRILPKPESLRFDDEGSFRDQRLIQWLEAQAIRISVIAGEAAWQVGKHSRHLEVLKENMSLLASELGPEVSAEELLSLSLAAKNEMHSLKGYSPNQWVFGQNKNRIQSYLQHGNHLPTSSVRNNSETFEEALQRSNAARQTFLKADSRRRVLRAARGHARKTQEFEMGQLVYFYRKGRNNTSKHEAGWHGPARVVAIEKQGDGQQNRTQGSVIWIVHATILYRCAPEQLRHVPVGVQGTFRELNGDSSPLQSLQQAGNRANYRDISQDLSGEPEDSELHDDEPREPSISSSANAQAPPARRITGKTTPHVEGGPDQEPQQQDRSDRGPETEAHQRQRGGEVPQHGHQRPGGGEVAGRQVRREDLQDSLRERCPVREVAGRAPGGQRQVHEPHGVRHENDPQAIAHDTAEFWKHADARRDECRKLRGLSRSGSRRAAPRSRRSDGAGSPGRGPQHEAAGGATGAGQSDPAAGDLPMPLAEHGNARAARGPQPPPHGHGAEHGARAQVRTERSRSPVGRTEGVYTALADGEDVLEWVPEESVGNALDLSVGDLGCRGSYAFDHEKLQFGRFSWRVPESAWETLPQNPEPKTHGNIETYFNQALEQQDQVFEIAMNIQPRDVHKVKTGARIDWVLNEKPKKRAEVQFRTLRDDEKLDFMKAMQGELSSYLEHEAVAIAHRHNVSPERILGMRWVLTWKVVTDQESGEVVGRKPKARLIIKGFQDPDLLMLKRDSPTLNTQNRNMVLGMAAIHKWNCYVGDIKTAFLNGDKTEHDREIYAEPPEEVRQMLNLKPHELFRILKAVYGLLHAPRAWAEKLAKELSQQGWIQSKLEPCIWRLYDEHNTLCGLIGIHVDDLLCCGSGQCFESHIETLRASFPFGSWKDLHEEAVTFCGCELRQTQGGSIELNQERYAESHSGSAYDQGTQGRARGCSD